MASTERTNNLLAALAVAIADDVRRATERAAGRSDAVPAVLASLRWAPQGRTIDEIRQIVGLTPSGGVRVVDRMVDDGLARRGRGDDRRTVVVTLTPRGRHVARAVLAARSAAVERYLGDLGEADRARLETLAERLLTTHVRQRLIERSTGEHPAWTCRLCDQDACGRPAGDCPAQREAQRAAAGG